MLEFLSNSPDETKNIGIQTASHLIPGSVVALKGTLGSGKTIFAKGIAFGLGMSECITSPTYTIINEYTYAAGILYHIDAYRLNGDKDFENIGGTEIINSGGICIIEWSEQIPNSLPADTITVSLEIKGVSSRLIKILGLATETSMQAAVL